MASPLLLSEAMKQKKDASGVCWPVPESDHCEFFNLPDQATIIEHKTTASHAMGLVRGHLHLLFSPATENATWGKKQISSIYQEDVDRSNSFSGVPAFHTTLTGRMKADERF
jgi:hypothetical protein